MPILSSKRSGNRKGYVPWNKGLKGKQIAWNKNVKMKEVIPNYKNSFSNKKHTQETKEKMHKKHKKLSIETKEKMSASRVGDKNPMWRDGVSKVFYPSEFDKDLKEFIKQRDGERCQFCGVESFLSIHHIDYNKKNNWEGNLITLCQKCNPKMNSKREEWSNYWTEYLNPKGAIMSDWRIKRMIKYGHIKIENVKEVYVGPSSVDLHLDNKAMILDANKFRYGEILDISKKEQSSEKFTEYKDWDEIIIYPGEFYILSTKEKITLSKSIAAFVHGRSSFARIGLNIHMAGFIDPMFSGNVTLEVSNFTKFPISIPKDCRICQIIFIPTTEVVKIGYGEKTDSKYQGQKGPTITSIHKDYNEK